MNKPNPDQPNGARPAFSLDDLYHMVAATYAEQNAHRPVSATFAHFVEVCGMLSVHDRQKKREEFEVEDALCKALGWFFPLLAKMRVASVEELVFRKFPYVCPYCRERPHSDAKCKNVKGTKKTVDHRAVREKYEENKHFRPRSLNGWQQMFDEIYPRSVDDGGRGRSTIGLLEELGELAEAVRVFEKHPKYFSGEAADVFSYLMGIANEHSLKRQMISAEFNFEAEFIQRYPGLCLQCGYEVCICPNVPESTVGRMSKELDLPSFDTLFQRDAELAELKGREIAGRVLQSVGGLSAISHRIPFDRGETNRAMILLCLRLADELGKSNAKLASSLREAGIRIGSQMRNAGSRANPDSSVELVRLLEEVWPLLNLAVIPDDGSLQAKIGKVLQAQASRLGIITALPKEFAAMRAMLDESREYPIAGDPNNYVVGRIPADDLCGTHLVVLTLLKEMGNNSAAAAATNLLRSFPKVEDVLMVGIAGGIPAPDNPDEHVRLGDVVVSNSQGVVQYMNLKVGVKKIELRSSTTKPSARMIGRINVLEAGRISGKYPWESYIERGTSLENSQRPLEATDKLYRWSGSVEEEIAHPNDVNRRTGKPKIHLGKIGTADILLKDPQLRDQLREDCGVKAVEMEGSGIADGAWTAGQHYLVIRGICDYCDPKKNDSWQGYAALAAAAYAAALIASVPAVANNLMPA